jgi:heat shock protein HtpX
MRLRTRLGLLARAVVALATGTSLLVAVGLLLALVGAGFGLVIPGLLSDLVGDLPLPVVVGFAALGAVGFPLAWVGIVRREFRHGRVRLLADAREPESDRERRLAGTVDRLAQQVDRPAPAVLVLDTDDPRCYTVPRAEGPAVVVSTGLLDALAPEGVEAVLAHEVAHLANRDHRVMTLALAPLVAVEELAEGVDGDTLDPRELFRVAAYGAMTWWGALGVGVFSRGRELAADSAAARLSGDPAALAGALRTLDETATDAPAEDLREHARSVDALSVHPTLDPSTDGGGGLTATHPPTAARIERLEALVERFETE